MKSKPEHERRERQDWLIVLLILLIGFLCVAVAGQYALRLSPSWKLNTDMESNLDPNSDFSTRKPIDFIEPLDEGILTKPAWESLFLTPGAKFATGTPLPSLPPPTATLPTTEAPTLPVGTNTLIATVTPVPTNTFIWLPPPPATATKKKPPPADTPTNTSVPTIDLEITMSDSGSYTPGIGHDYTVIVGNNSAYDVTGAVVNDLFGAQITGASWICTPSVPTAICANGAGNPFTDTVNLPAGSLVTYTVTANVSPFAVGPLANTATVAILPLESDPGDNTAMLTTAGPGGGGGGQINIGPGDGLFDTPLSGNSITMVLSPGITGSFVFYERRAVLGGPDIQMDMVQIQISDDGVTWYPVFYWGDGSPGNNGSIPGFYCPVTETDNCIIQVTDLYPYPGTGIVIDIASLGYTGTYPWIQITCPLAGSGPAPGESGDGCDIDAIEP